LILCHDPLTSFGGLGRIVSASWFRAVLAGAILRNFRATQLRSQSPWKRLQGKLLIWELKSFPVAYLHEVRTETPIGFRTFSGGISSNAVGRAALHELT
jgi:hypothetical protein